MEKQEIKSEILKKVEDFANELMNDCKSDNNERYGFVLIADDISYHRGLAVNSTLHYRMHGNHLAIVECIAAILANNHELIEEATKLLAIKNFTKTL